MTASNHPAHPKLIGILGLVLVVGTLGCYCSVYHFDFINFDDPLYAYSTPMVRRGLSWPGFVWAFKSVAGGNWNPLVWLSLMADSQLYGLHAGGYHVTNVLLHAANVLLLFFVFRKMTGAVWRSASVAAIFAWHPLHVESVAWVSERKDVLSGLFLLLALCGYAGFVRAAPSRRIRYYLSTLLFFALGLMSKPMLVTLPMVFLLLDYWPLRRTESLRKLVVEKLPLLAMSAAVCLVTMVAQQHAGAVGLEPLPLRLENVFASYFGYIRKMFWPSHLSIFYLFPESIPVWQWGGGITVLSLLSIAALLEWKRRPYLAVGWLWFLGTLVPVIGLIQVGGQAMADRYTYLPFIGLAIMVSWGLADLAEIWPRARTGIVTAAALGLAACLTITVVQVGYWRNNSLLYEHILEFDPGNYVIHSNLGEAEMEEGKLDQATAHFYTVLELKPRVSKPYNNLGKTLALQGKLDESMLMFSNAIALDPKLEESYYNLGNAFMTKGNLAGALPWLKKAVSLNPDDLLPQKALIHAFFHTGQPAQALPYCEAEVEADPANPHACYDLGEACLAAKQPERAVVNYKKALRLAPGSPQCLNALAWVYATSPEAKIRDGRAAIQLARRACEITKRQDTTDLDTLAAAYAETGEFAEAIRINEEIRLLATTAHDSKTLEMARQRAELYQAGKPCRDIE